MSKNISIMKFYFISRKEFALALIKLSDIFITNESA